MLLLSLFPSYTCMSEMLLNGASMHAHYLKKYAIIKMMVSQSQRCYFFHFLLKEKEQLHGYTVTHQSAFIQINKNRICKAICLPSLLETRG